MLRVLVLATVVLTGADHWTTWVCLKSPVEGWSVSEANPLARWLFAEAGLGPGLLIDTAVTLGAISFLATTGVFARSTRVGLLAVISGTTGFAVASNLDAISRMGLAPWAGGS